MKPAFAIRIGVHFAFSFIAQFGMGGIGLVDGGSSPSSRFAK
jgi:hypothetical protein